MVVSDAFHASVPASYLVDRSLGQEAPPAPATPVASTVKRPEDLFLSGATLLGAGLLVIGGMYYWKTAPKMKGFWKGWGYFNGTMSYVGVGVYALVGLGFLAKGVLDR